MLKRSADENRAAPHCVLSPGESRVRDWHLDDRMSASSQSEGPDSPSLGAGKGSALQVASKQAAYC